VAVVCCPGFSSGSVTTTTDGTNVASQSFLCFLYGKRTPYFSMSPVSLHHVSNLCIQGSLRVCPSSELDIFTAVQVMKELGL
jgi:hypothetical protein